MLNMKVASPKPVLRLHFLDGLRGLACLYVLLFHASTPHIPYGGELSPFMAFVKLCISCGHFSVVFFIVLSGFSIMLPIARSGTGQLKGGFWDYARRRARRILPPYYVAVVLSIALIVGYNFISRRSGLGPPVVDNALSAGAVVSHLLLLHNLSFDWAYRINGPLWSVATEWQIYFLFALLFLPLWRRAGNTVALLLAWLMGLLPFFLLPRDDNFFWASPWFMGSFMFGVWGAAIGFDPAWQDSWLRRRAPWGVFSALCFALIVFLVGTGRSETWPLPLVDSIVSLFAFFLINACTQVTTSPERRSSLLVRVLGSRALVYLGGFSYSLYLVQHPVLRLAEKVVAKLTKSVDANIQIHLLAVVPVTIAVAWLFAEFFERPFTTGGLILPAIRRRLLGTPSQSAS
jgi:peptidoglycan/LPS O-acetylase OafA/YrhL